MDQKDDPEPAAFVDIQIALSNKSANECKIPSPTNFSQWVRMALPPSKVNSELTIRLVEEEESQYLNKQYRGKNKPTNILSFPYTHSVELPSEVDIPLLGDLAICAPIIKSEADEQGKEEIAHWAHMVIHGTLHLLGYDHIEEKDAIEMETLEAQLITSLGYPAPYEAG